LNQTHPSKKSTENQNNVKDVIAIRITNIKNQTSEKTIVMNFMGVGWR
jgi:polysaccharide deacetylase 2 family uncharacterized protein YibQ